VRLAIADNGPGFAPKILSRAFEPYVTSKARGTGLGLPMVKKSSTNTAAVSTSPTVPTELALRYQFCC
jgi:nitrogen fixation/metabolism regulation signal transduction histidine kinase